MTNSGKRVVWVTGGGSGIGEAGAEALAADGWTVVVSGRRKDALDAVVAKIAGRGGKAEAIPVDVSKAADVNKAAEQILAKHGRIDLLVNSAGINVPKRSWADMELDGWNKLVDINLNGVLYCMRAGAAGDAGAKGRLHHQRRILGRPSCLENAGPGLHHDQACGAGADPFLQHGRMRQRFARLLPVSRRGGDPDPEIAAGGALGSRAGADAAV
jgi:NAD(P)-dependent dehydrogenase (short-subunit alcohol dehydrogenase family)